MAARRPSARLVAAVTVGVVTAGLLLRLAVIHGTAPLPPEPSAPAAPPAASAPPPISPVWRIAYECGDAVCTAFADGSGARRVLPDAAQPAWSPDRRRLAFARAGNVWVADADGGNARQVTFWPARRPSPAGDDPVEGIAWDAPDGVLSFGREETFPITLPGGGTGAIRGVTLFHASLAPPARQTYTAGTRFPFAVPARLTPAGGADAPRSGGSFERLAPRFDVTEDHTPFAFADNACPAWSPAGDKLAFVRNGDVWLARKSADPYGYARDWDVSRVAACARYDGHTVGASHWTVAATGLSWAPDGSFLAYGAERITGSGEEDLHVVRGRATKDADGDDQVVYDDATLPGLYGSHPSVSPDGRWILFAGRDDDGKPALKAVTPDGRNERVLLRGGRDGAW